MSKWLSVKEYSKKIGAKSPQVVYNWIYMKKIKHKVRKRKIEKEILEIYY